MCYYWFVEVVTERTADMTLGEKIKYYRGSLGITQAQFSESSGIGLSIIKKLERNFMNPKPKLLKEVADALGVSIYEFTDFDILTVSDVMSLITKMDEQVDMEFNAEYDKEGNPIPESIQISFKHPAVNRQMAQLIKITDLQGTNALDIDKTTNPAEIEAYTQLNEDLEEMRLSICREPIVVSKKHQNGHISTKV